MTVRRTTRWSVLGRVPYRHALELQHAIRAGVKAGTGAEHLLLLEHPPVYTLGRNASPADVLADPAHLAAEGIEVVECNRGGQVTYHGPGQLVGYPIVDLDPDRRDIRRYVRDLQEVLIRTLGDVGIAARRRDGKEHIGVWVDPPATAAALARPLESGGKPGKIASLGVHLSRWVTTHGFALNVDTDLSRFASIVACGLPEVDMVSVRSLLGEAPPLPTVADRVAAHFGDVFERRMERIEPAELPWPALAAAGGAAR